MKDTLGDRMKGYYESRSQLFLPRRTFTMIRLDGKAFHTYTKGFARPYDLNLMRFMDRTAIELCKAIQGAKLAFVQSDEISIVLTDFDTEQTDAWYDGNIQKMTSVSASIATAAFNNEILHSLANRSLDGDDEAKTDLLAAHANCLKPAYFDSRVFTLPTASEVINCLVWRQQDATRNSISMAAQSVYSHKELHQKSSSEKQEMLFQKGINWDKYPVGFKRGRAIVKEEYPLTAVDQKTGQSVTTMRSRWVSVDPPIFSQDREFVLNRLPKP